MTTNAFTNLVMTGVGVAPYSARGVTQTLAHISQAANTRRTVNGALVDLAFDGFKKYKSTISGTDQRPPSFDGKWPGLTVTVDCIAELSYAQATESPGRTVVSGSEIVEGLFTSYRPRLTMKILSFTISEDEYGAQVGWSMELEEV